MCHFKLVLVFPNKWTIASCVHKSNTQFPRAQNVSIRWLLLSLQTKTPKLSIYNHKLQRTEAKVGHLCLKKDEKDSFIFKIIVN